MYAHNYMYEDIIINIWVVSAYIYIVFVAAKAAKAAEQSISHAMAAA